MFRFILPTAALFAATPALAEDRDVLLTLGIGAAAAEGVGPQGYGRLAFMGERFGLEGGVREGAVGVIGDIGDPGLAESDGVFVGCIDLLGRFDVGPVVLKAGLAHHHETPAPVVRDNPVGTTIGVADGIVHRSGFEVGVESDLEVRRLLPDAEAPIVDQLRLVTALAADYMPDDGGPHLTTWLEAGLQLAF